MNNNPPRYLNAKSGLDQDELDLSSGSTEAKLTGSNSIDAFFADLRKIKKLDKDSIQLLFAALAEKRLVRHEGEKKIYYFDELGHQIIEELTIQNMGLVPQTLKQMRISQNHPDYEDCLQEGYFALKKAVEHYELSRGKAFSTYAIKIIKRRIVEYGRQSNSLAAMGVSASSQKKLSEFRKLLNQLIQLQPHLTGDQAIQALKSKMELGDKAVKNRLEIEGLQLKSLDMPIGNSNRKIAEVVGGKDRSFDYMEMLIDKNPISFDELAEKVIERVLTVIENIFDAQYVERNKKIFMLANGLASGVFEVNGLNKYFKVEKGQNVQQKQIANFKEFSVSKQAINQILSKINKAISADPELQAMLQHMRNLKKINFI